MNDLLLLDEALDLLSESNDISSLDPDFIKKDKIKLSTLTMKSRQRNDEGKSLVLSWYNDKEFVATILVDTIPAIDGYKWFGSFRVSKKYRGCGLGNQIIDLITSSKYKAGSLSVYTDNEVAINLYKKHGFKIDYKTKGSGGDEFYIMRLSKNKLKSTNESNEMSKLDNNFKKKKRIKLSDLKRTTINHGEWSELRWYKGKDHVAVVCVDNVYRGPKELNPYGKKTFYVFEVSYKYKGHGIGGQIVDLLINEYNVESVTAYTDNEIAVHLYKKHGFTNIIKRKDSDGDEFYVMELDKNKLKSTNESKDISTVEDEFKKKSGKSFKLIDLNSQAALKYVSDKWRNGKYASIAVCKEDDKLAGYVYVNKSGTIAPLEVYKEYRGYGLSEILMKEAINKYKGYQLGVYSDNEVAIRLYKKLGFVKTGEKKYADGDIVYFMKLKSKLSKDDVVQE